MKVLLTGATGFIGRHAGGALVEAGHEVIRLARSGADMNADIRSLSPEAVPNVDAIVHLAGLADAGVDGEDPYQIMSTNAVGALRVLELARRQRCRMIIASSMRVYSPSSLRLTESKSATEPTRVYGMSKLTAEIWARVYSETYRFPVAALRFFSVYGPGQRPRASGSGVVSIFVHRALAEKDIVVYHRQARDFVHVDDVSRSILAALKSGREGWRSYNIATGVSTTIEELAQLVGSATGGKSFIDLSMAERPGDSYIPDVSRAEDELGYSARIGLRQGIKSYVECLKEAATN